VAVEIAVHVKTTDDETDQSEATVAVVDEQASPEGTASATVVFESTITEILTHHTVPAECAPT
jgi:hypothetical protein